MNHYNAPSLRVVIWKRMFDYKILIASVLGVLITWPVCWILIYKLGWRFTDWSNAPLPDNLSFLAYMLISNTLLAVLGSPFLAFSIIAQKPRS